MANYYRGIKGRKSKKACNVKSSTIPRRPAAVKTALSKAMPYRAVVVKPDSVRRQAATVRLVNTMNLDEMLEASKVIEMGIKGERIPEVKSSKAQKYARTMLCFNRRDDTRPIAEEMRHDLNVRIIKVNKKTTDAAESRRLYHKLMAEE